MDARERFMEELKKAPLQDADVIFLAAGDGMSRVPYTAQLYKEGRAPVIGIVSGDRRYEYGSAPAGELADELRKLGVPDDALVVRETAMNTKEESVQMLDLIHERGWHSVLIVTSPHHQYRAFLTWLATVQAAGSTVHVINAPVPLSMTEETPQGRREDLLPQEFERIAAYQTKGDVASYEEGIEYLKAHA